MASMIFSFDSASPSSNLTTYKEIEVEPSLGGYAQANSGHQAIDISAIASATGTAHTLQLVWCDYDASRTNVLLGVTKADAITVTPGTRRTSTDNSSGGYVCAVSAASSSSSLVRTIGVGDQIDARSSPVPTSAYKRRLFIGLTAAGGGGGTVTVIVTPTKII